jgi:uncharacterized glyoxalase superfamily protein PhnB
LRSQVGPTSTPTLPVAKLVEAQGFYEQAGFDVRVYRDENGNSDGFAFVNLDDESVFDFDEIDDFDIANNHAGCYIVTADADAMHARLEAVGLPITPIEDQPWGMHEFTLTDPSGNNIRIGRSVNADG